MRLAPSAQMSGISNHREPSPGGQCSPRRSSAGEKIRLNEQDLKGAFRIFDKRNKGAITKKDITRVLTMLGQEAGTEEVEELMGEVRRDCAKNFNESILIWRLAFSH